MHEKIIDTHIHIWDFDQASYEWLENDTTILNRNYRIEELENERITAGVSEGVLVQAANNNEDTQLMLHVAGQTNWIKGVVGWLPLTDRGATEKLLTTYLADPLFKGVRHLIHNEADARWLLQDEVIASLSLLVRHNLPYDIVGTLPAHIETALELANKLPELRMVFDHLNQPPMSKHEKSGAWSELMSEASKHTNFFAKISGLGTATGNPGGWTGKDIAPYVEYVLEHFGEDRCFCGGDWPVSLLAGSYQKTWQTYQDIITGLLDEPAQQKVFYQNAASFYQLNQ